MIYSHVLRSQFTVHNHKWFIYGFEHFAIIIHWKMFSNLEKSRIIYFMASTFKPFKSFVTKYQLNHSWYVCDDVYTYYYQWPHWLKFAFQLFTYIFLYTNFHSISVSSKQPHTTHTQNENLFFVLCYETIRETFNQFEIWFSLVWL